MTKSIQKALQLLGRSHMALKVANDVCTVCGKTVYPMDKLQADSAVFHKTCLKCAHCNVTLSLGKYAALEGKYFCKPHFKQLFMAKGNYNEGFGSEKHSKNWTPQVNTGFKGVEAVVHAPSVAAPSKSMRGTSPHPAHSPTQSTPVVSPSVAAPAPEPVVSKGAVANASSAFRASPAESPETEKPKVARPFKIQSAYVGAITFTDSPLSSPEKKEPRARDVAPARQERIVASAPVAPAPSVVVQAPAAESVKPPSQCI